MYWDNGKANGNYYSILGLYIIGIMENTMEAAKLPSSQPRMCSSHEKIGQHLRQSCDCTGDATEAGTQGVAWRLNIVAST